MTSPPGRIPDVTVAQKAQDEAATLLVIDICASCSSTLYDRVGKLAASGIGGQVVVYAPVPADIEAHGESVAAAVQSSAQRVSEMVTRMHGAGIQVREEVEEVESLADAVQARIASIRPELVLACSAQSNRRYALHASALIRMLLEQTVPHLWIVSSPGERKRDVILAATDTDEGSAAERIRDRVLSMTQVLATGLKKEAHMLHTYADSGVRPLLEKLGSQHGTGIRPEDIERDHVHRAHDAASRMGYRKEFVHIDNGELADTLKALVAPLGVDVVVMGASRKSGFTRFVTEGHLESVVDAGLCDVLIVRP